MAITKVTKKDNFTMLRDCVLNHTEWFNESEVDRLIEFIDHEVEQLDKRAVSAKKYAKKAAKAKDTLSDAITTVLSNTEYAMTIPEIITALSEELAATPQKLAYRLNQMVESNIITKSQVSIKEEGKSTRKVNAYMWITADTDADTVIE